MIDTWMAYCRQTCIPRLYCHAFLYLPGRSKSPKSPRGSSQERPTSASENFTVREGSLKAWKLEQDKIKAEEDEKERVRSAKRSKSPKKVGNARNWCLIV